LELAAQARQNSSRILRVKRGARSKSLSALKAKRRAYSAAFALQARQDSNLQPPVLETGALPVELRTYETSNVECPMSNIQGSAPLNPNAYSLVLGYSLLDIL
jgi:hypothetical protein